MATKYVLVTLFILIVLPSSLPTPLSGKSIIPRGRFGNIRDLFNDAWKLYKKFSKKQGHKNDMTGQPAGTITDGYSVITFNMMIGTPPVAYNGIWDMTDDLSWINCEPSDFIYDPYKSSTSSWVSCTDLLCQSEWSSTCPNNCSDTFDYDDLYSTQVTLARDNFTLGDLPLPEIVFGCGTQNEGTFSNIHGIIGFGWGNFSLVYQMGYENFSYCGGPNILSGSYVYIFFDSAPNLMGNPVQSTPLIQNPSFTSAYYVNLLGISVGDEPLKIPKTTFSLLPDGSGGVILDSGTFLTYLEREGYNQVKNALLNQVRLSPKDGKDIGLDLCFLSSDLNELLTMPTITLQFDGAYMVLDYSNYMLIDETDGLLCLAMLPSDDISIFGYLLQSGKHIFIDIKNLMVSFQIEDCGKL